MGFTSNVPARTPVVFPAASLVGTAITSTCRWVRREVSPALTKAFPVLTASLKYARSETSVTGPGLVTVVLARTLPCASIHARPPVKSCPFRFVTRRKYSRIPVVSPLTTTGAWDIESSVPISPRKMESKMVAATTAFARASLRSVLCASWYCRQARAPQTAAKSRRAASASSGSQRRNDADSTSSARAVLLSGMSNFGIAIPREKPHHQASAVSSFRRAPR